MKRNKGPQYANGRTMAPQMRPSRGPSSSPRPTPRPATAQEGAAVRRGNRIAAMTARQDEVLRRR
jgi:hypothetical protein